MTISLNVDPIKIFDTKDPFCLSSLLENLKASATPAQIASADAAITLASINHTTTLGALDVGKVSRRIARKSLCDRAYELMNSDLAHLNSICPAIDIPIPDTAIKTLMNKMFAFSDDLMISLETLYFRN